MSNQKQYLQEKKQEMEKCEHLFIKQTEGYWDDKFHIFNNKYTPCIVKCLHCGLTNLYIVKDNSSKMDLIYSFIYNKFIEINNMVFNNQYFSAYGNNGWFDENALNLISHESLYSEHPHLLYHLARIIKSDANNDELFEIMKNLFEIETLEERIGLLNKKEMNELLERYKQIKKRKLSL